MIWLCCSCGIDLPAEAQTKSLAQELPYAAGIALEKEKKIEQQLDFYKN